MKPKYAILSEPIEKMGSPTSRWFYHRADQMDGYIFCSSLRPQYSGCRCPLASMGQLRSLCFSPICNPVEVDKQVQEIQELPNNCSSSLMASERMVPRSSRCTKNSSLKTGSSITANVKVTAPRTVHSSTNRLEIVIHLGREKGLSELVA